MVWEKFVFRNLINRHFITSILGSLSQNKMIGCLKIALMFDLFFIQGRWIVELLAFVNINFIQIFRIISKKNPTIFWIWNVIKIFIQTESIHLWNSLLNKFEMHNVAIEY